MKRIGAKILLAAFVCVICLSQAVCGLIGTSANYENRAMAEKPELNAENYAEFPKEYDKYANDHILLRNELVTVNNYIDYFIFQQASNTNVIMGKDGWLFYCNADDGDPIRSYRGMDLYSEDELKAVADNCVKQKAYAESLGKEFVILIAPNKERVYAEHMPDMYGKPAEKYRAKQIADYLTANTDVRVVYLYDALEQAKDTDILYYKSDTHWNGAGAYVGCREVLKELGIDLPGIADVQCVRTGPLSGDLAGMNGLAGFDFGDTYYAVSGYDTHGFEYAEYDFPGVVHGRAEGADKRKLYMVRDSFGTSMIEIMGSQFDESWMRHFSTYTPEDIKAYDPDVIVYETVERYAYNLMTFSLE